MNLSDFPALNATLNAASAVLLLCGYVCIRLHKVKAHATFMISAAAASAAFLTCYIIYHVQTGTHRPPAGTSPTLVTIYRLVLFPHLTMAMVMLPMIVTTFWRAGKRDWARHRRIARPTFWVWLYVSLSGLVVYWMLYKLFGTLPVPVEGSGGL